MGMLITGLKKNFAGSQGHKEFVFGEQLVILFPGSSLRPAHHVLLYHMHLKTLSYM